MNKLYVKNERTTIIIIIKLQTYCYFNSNMLHFKRVKPKQIVFHRLRAAIFWLKIMSDRHGTRDTWQLICVQCSPLCKKCIRN